MTSKACTPSRMSCSRMQRTCSAHIHLSDVISPAYSRTPGSRAPASRTRVVLVGVPAPPAVLYTCHATSLPSWRRVTPVLLPDL
eukprot:scaffold24888_cov140-Isochrysis_galbana.AAC.2